MVKLINILRFNESGFKGMLNIVRSNNESKFLCIVLRFLTVGYCPSIFCSHKHQRLEFKDNEENLNHKLFLPTCC